MQELRREICAIRPDDEILALSQLAGGAIALVLLLARRADRRTPLPVGALIALLGGLWLGLRS